MLGQIVKTEQGSIESFPTDLTTPLQRAAWIMGRMLEQVPGPVRPIIRSMLLPKLETLSSEDLIDSLVTIKDSLLPWVLWGDTGEPVYDADNPPPALRSLDSAVVQDQSGREGALRGEDGEWEDHASRPDYPDNGLSNGRHRPEA